jgi:biopolymer transport protein ExbB
MSEPGRVAHAWSQVLDLWHGGGITMPALFCTAFLLWFALGYRLLTLRRGDGRPLRRMLDTSGGGREPSGVIDTAVARGRALWQQHGGPVPTRRLDDAFADLEADLSQGALLVKCLIAVAPLLGLLGTVSGLISTFGSLGSSATSTASEGIAGGIVEALYATQVGLAIAVPGLLMGGALGRREQRLAGELDELKAILAGARAQRASR